jgi:hypothetical protein
MSLTPNLFYSQIIADWNLPKKRNSNYEELIKSMNEPFSEEGFENTAFIETQDNEQEEDDHDLNDLILSVRGSKQVQAEACLALALQIFRKKASREETIYNLEILQKHTSLLKEARTSELSNAKKPPSQKYHNEKVVAETEELEPIVRFLQSDQNKTKNEKDFDSLAKKLVSHFDDSQYNAFKSKIAENRSLDYSKILSYSEKSEYDRLAEKYSFLR